jgi:hypothetical protein
MTVYKSGFPVLAYLKNYRAITTVLGVFFFLPASFMVEYEWSRFLAGLLFFLGNFGLG